MRSGVSRQMSREKRGVDDVISEESHYTTVRRRNGRRNKCEKYCRMIFYSGAQRWRNDIFLYISNFSPAALIRLNFIFIPFWQIFTFLQIQLLLSSYFVSHSPCAFPPSLSLSFVLSACITTHTCSISLSLSIPLFIPLFFISIPFSLIAFLSPPPSSVCALNVVQTQALNLKMPHTVSITHFQCDDSRPPGTKYTICHHSIFSLFLTLCVPILSPFSYLILSSLSVPAFTPNLLLVSIHHALSGEKRSGV